jgi:hypothetical protein
LLFFGVFLPEEVIHVVLLLAEKKRLKQTDATFAPIYLKYNFLGDKTT